MRLSRRLAIRFSVAFLLSATLVAAQVGEQLTEGERLRLQVAALQQQVAVLAYTLEVCRIEQAHPGHTFTPGTGLVPTP